MPPMFPDTPAQVYETLRPVLDNESLIHAEDMEYFQLAVQQVLVPQFLNWARAHMAETEMCMKSFGATPFFASHWGRDEKDRWTCLMIIRPDMGVPGKVGIEVIGTAQDAAPIFSETFGRKKDVLAEVRGTWDEHLHEAADNIPSIQYDDDHPNACAFYLTYVGPSPAKADKHIPSEN